MNCHYSINHLIILKITFKNEKGEPINFMKSPVALTIEIKQV